LKKIGFSSSNDVTTTAGTTNEMDRNFSSTLKTPSSAKTSKIQVNKNGRTIRERSGSA